VARLGDIGDRVAFVGSDLHLTLEADGVSSAGVQFGFDSDVPNMCHGDRCRGGIRQTAGEEATFSWVPTPEDVGIWSFQFFVNDGASFDAETISIEVRSSVGYAGLPRFVQPLGTGSTLDLAKNDCFDLEVVVDDPDSRAVAIAQEPPLIDGGELEVHDGFTASWSWCPTGGQLRAGDHRQLVLSASDGVNPPTLKSYLLVLRRPAKGDCDGAPPSIDHSSRDWSSVGDVVVEARIGNESGLKHAPLLYYSTTRPAEPVDVGRMTQLSMELVTGDSADGLWSVRIPNPTAVLPEGASATLYYVIAASVTDTSAGACDLHAQVPSSGAFAIDVRSTGSSPSAVDGAGPCEPCSADRQCGGTDDLCVRMGTRGDSFCLAGCARNSDCPAGFGCGAAAVSSVGGTTGRQCIPAAGTCAPDADATCADDSFEDNDSIAAARAAAPLAPGEHAGLVSCHLGDADDEDWFPVRLREESQVVASLSGDAVSDLDLALMDSTGRIVQVSESLRSSEEVTDCLTPGDYFLRVYSFGRGRNPYRLSWSARPTVCAASCAPDSRESDDDAPHARRVDPAAGYESLGNTICGGNDDWYSVRLTRGQMVIVELSFIMSAPDEDLDLHFLDQSMTDLTPCTEADPSTCSAFQGQSLDSNEYYDHTVEMSGTYYIVVHGFDGSENNYDIRIRLME